MNVSYSENEIYWKLRAADFLIETSELVGQTEVIDYRDKTLHHLKISAKCDGVHLVNSVDDNLCHVLYSTDEQTRDTFNSTGFSINVEPTDEFYYTSELPTVKRSHFLKPYTTAVLIPLNKPFFKGVLILTWKSKTMLPDGYSYFITLVMGRIKGIIRTMSSTFAGEDLMLKFQVVFRTISQGILFLENSGKEAMVNPRAKEMLALESHLENFTPERIAEAMQKLISKAINHAEINAVANTLFSDPKKKIDHWIWKFTNHVYQVTCSPFISDRVQGRLWVFEDISNLYFANEQIQLKNDRLEGLNVEKNDLISIVSHDLRSPLTQIKMLGSFVAQEQDRLSEEQRQMLSLIDTVCDKGIYLIKDLLDISAIEQQQTNKKIEKVDWADNVEKSLETFKTTAAQKNIKLQIKIVSAPCYVMADQEYLRRILENLVSNAIKYSHQNKTVAVTLAQNSDHKWLLSVSDQGQGIREEDMKRLFAKFGRLSARPTGKESSSGLGLYIVKSLVEELQGRIWCESEWGIGSTFTVELPWAAA